MTLLLGISSLGFAQGISLPSNSGKVGFLKAEDSSPQETAAFEFFKSLVPEEEGVITSADQISIEKFDCIWIHTDRIGTAENLDNLPDIFTSAATIAAVKKFVAQGGNLYLSGHATKLISRIGRVSDRFSPNIFGSGDGGDGDDRWVINANFAGIDNRNHPIFNNMTVDKDAYPHETFGMLWGGGNSIRREDHNCMWEFARYGYDSDRVNRFQNDTKSRVLAAWGQTVDDGNGGLIEFLPVQYGGGTIVANGFAACQWYMHDNQTNYYADNLRLLTANVISYLAPENELNKPNRPETAFDESLLQSTGRVALYVGYENEESLRQDNNKEGIAVFDFFKQTYPENIVYSWQTELLTKENFDCVWIHLDRPGVTGKENLPDVFKGDDFVDVLKKFREDGGNLYFSKQAVFIATEVDDNIPVPNETGYNKKAANSDIYYANITHNGRDFTTHPLFHNVIQYNNLGMAMIELMSGENEIDDNTSMWNMNAFEGHDNFCNRYNATVLATWGHNDNDAMDFAGIIEFRPGTQTQNIKRRENSAIAEERQGFILVNGMGGYEWSPSVGENESIDQIQQLTANILAYLSPGEAVETPNALNVTIGEGMSKDFDTSSHTYEFTGLIEFDQPMTYETDFIVTVAPASDNWVKQSDYDAEDLQAAYEKALNVPGAGLVAQYKSLNTEYVDGFFTHIGKISVTPVEGSSDKIFSIAVDLPCSGVYNITVSGDGVNYSGEETGSITVYPNPAGFFGGTGGLSIEGFTFSGSDSSVPEISIPQIFIDSFYENEETRYMKVYSLGTYFLTSFSIVQNETEDDVNYISLGDNVSETTDSYAPEAANYYALANLRALKGLTSSSMVTLNVTMEKNGASKDYQFSVANDLENNFPTSVESVGSEDADRVEYYNLQGIKVARPEKGIYIRVKGQQRTKVLF